MRGDLLLVQIYLQRIGGIFLSLYVFNNDTFSIFPKNFPIPVHYIDLSLVHDFLNVILPIHLSNH